MNDWYNKIGSAFPKTDYRSCNFNGDWTKHFINDYVDSIFNSGIMKAQEELAANKNEHLPKSLFKFYPPSPYSLINIENRALYLSSPRDFNDQFDSYVCIEAEKFKKYYLLKRLKELNLRSKNEEEGKVSEKEYYEIYHSGTRETDPPIYLNKARPKHFIFTLFDIRKKKSRHLSGLLYEIVEEARRECRKKIDYLRNMEFRISCFSNFKDEAELLKNTTMWSHYADNHRGFCIKYKMDFKNVSNENSIRCGFFPVNYTCKVPRLSPRELMKLKFNNDELVLSRSVLKTAYKTMITKSTSWDYEKEWRLIISKYDSDILVNNSIPFLDIEAIYVGSKTESNFRKYLVQFAAKNNIQIYQARLSNEKFELRLHELFLNSLEEEEFRNRRNLIAQLDNKNDKEEKIKKLSKEKCK